MSETIDLTRAVRLAREWVAWFAAKGEAVEPEQPNESDWVRAIVAMAGVCDAVRLELGTLPSRHRRERLGDSRLNRIFDALEAIDSSIIVVSEINETSEPTDDVIMMADTTRADRDRIRDERAEADRALMRTMREPGPGSRPDAQSGVAAIFGAAPELPEEEQASAVVAADFDLQAGGSLAAETDDEDMAERLTEAAMLDAVEGAPAMPPSAIARGQEAHAAMMQRLTDLGRLPDDWGGSEKLSERALKVARHLVEGMQSRGHLVLRLAPMADGGVGLTYLEGERRARFDVYNDEPGSVVVVMRGSADAHDRYVESWESDAIEIMSLFLRANSLDTETDTETANLRAQLKAEADEHVACAEELRLANAKLDAKLDAIATRSYGTESLFSIVSARTTLENTEHLDPGESADVARVDLWVELREACNEIERLQAENANLRGAVEMLGVAAKGAEEDVERLTVENGRLDHELVALRASASDDIDALKSIAAAVEQNLPAVEDVVESVDWCTRIANAGADLANARGEIEMLNINAAEREAEIERLTKERDEADIEAQRLAATWRAPHMTASIKATSLEAALEISRADHGEPLADRLVRVRLVVLDLQRAARAKAETLARWKRRAKRAEERVAELKHGDGGAMAVVHIKRARR